MRARTGKGGNSHALCGKRFHRVKKLNLAVGKLHPFVRRILPHGRLFNHNLHERIFCNECGFQSRCLLRFGAGHNTDIFHFFLSCTLCLQCFFQDARGARLIGS